MMSLAEELNLNRYYIAKDNLKFYEHYKSEVGAKKYHSYHNSTARALAFMSVILEDGISIDCDKKIASIFPHL